MDDMPAETMSQIEAIRIFNRMYAQRIGAMDEQIFGSDFSLTEVRVLHELSLHDSITASELGRVLHLDGGYLSRILHKFEDAKLVLKEKSGNDARQRNISLTTEGRKQWNRISQNVNGRVYEMLAPLSFESRQKLVEAMLQIRELLACPAPQQV